MVSKDFWIEAATKNKNALHKKLGISQDKKIPTATLKTAEKRGGKIAKEARLAETLKGFKNK